MENKILGQFSKKDIKSLYQKPIYTTKNQLLEELMLPVPPTLRRMRGMSLTKYKHNYDNRHYTGITQEAHRPTKHFDPEIFVDYLEAYKQELGIESHNPNSRKEVDLNTKRKFRNGHTIADYEIELNPSMIASNMMYLGNFDTAKTLQKHNLLTSIRKEFTLDQWQKAAENGVDLRYCIINLGLRDEDYTNMEEIYTKVEQKPVFICFDIARGSTPKLRKQITKLRHSQLYNHAEIKPIIIAGNVNSELEATQLIEVGVDVLKVGIGPGGKCDTARVTGFSAPQLHAINNVVNVANLAGAHIIADGGINLFSSDNYKKPEGANIVAALAAGADFTMVGSNLVGYDENLPEQATFEVAGISYQVLEQDEITGKVVRVRSMGSASAAYAALNNKSHNGHDEGALGWTNYKGSLDNMVEQLMQGLRSATSYSQQTALELIRWYTLPNSRISSTGVINRVAGDKHENKQ